VPKNGKISSPEKTEYTDSINQIMKYKFTSPTINKNTRGFSSNISISIKECAYCFENQQTNHWGSSLMSPTRGKNNNQAMQNIIKKSLDKKYLTSRDYFNGKVITDIIYNECNNIVSIFKDFLILDDVSEFLKRSYSTQESLGRLPKVIDFYEKYSKVFPNYVNLPENKFMFKNIERKQRHIDEKQRVLGKIKKENLQKSEKKLAYINPDGYSIDMYNRNKLFGADFLKSMDRLDEESLVHRQQKEIPTRLEEVMLQFCDLDSDTSKIFKESNISINISLSNVNDESFNNKFKKNEIMPDFNHSTSDDKSLTASKSKPKIAKNLGLFNPKNIKVHDYNQRRLKLNEQEIKEKFNQLKEKFNNSSAQKSYAISKTPREVNNSQNSTNKSSRKSIKKIKSASNKSMINSIIF
jgi:hypothetical protein